MNSVRTHFFAVFIGLLVIVTYVWFISAGRWTAWSDTTNFYNQLAESFQHGQLSLLAKPDPILATLSNPYDPGARSGLHYPWDVSYYKGRYFLYWGPAPALLLAVIKILIPREIGDQYLVFAFSAGILLFQILLLLRIRQLFFRGLPAWTLSMGILVAGLISPLLWDLNRPTIYEAAITAGEFFFMGGFYFAFTALEQRPASTWRLILCGAFWALAVGSRVSQVLAVGFMAILLCFILLRRETGGLMPSRIVRAASGVMIPLILGGAALGWYNWARFGSITDFGFTYQLTGRDLHETQSSLYSPIYAPQNFYNYLFNPFEVIERFPFVKPLSGDEQPVLSNYDLPTYYMVEDEITGLVYTAPFLLFALVPLFSLARKRTAKHLPSGEDEELSLQAWTVAGLAGSFLLGFIPLLVFFYAAPRYAIDFIGPLSVLAVMGFWEIRRITTHTSAWRKLLLLLGASLAVISIALSIILAFTSHIGRFKYFNPDLVDFLSRLFTR